MDKIIFKKKRIMSLVLIITLTFMLLNNGSQGTFSSLYTPTIGDSFSYTGNQTQDQIQNSFRIVSNSTNGNLLDYFDQQLESNTIMSAQNVNFAINSINQSSVGVSLAMNGYQNATGSFQTNNTKAYDSMNAMWHNSTNTNNLNPQSFNETQSDYFNYTQGMMPSSLNLGQDFQAYVGIPEIPIGSDNNNQGSNQGCSSSDMIYYNISNGEIALPSINPFTNLTSYTLVGIYSSATFNMTEFNQNNLAYVNNHPSDNISWNQVTTNMISGIDQSYDGTQVVLVYHLISQQDGMLQASEGYCSTTGGSTGSSDNPLAYFGNLSVIKLTWHELTNTNRPFNINGYDYLLSTKTEEGFNQTNRAITVNMSVGDSGSTFYIMVNLSLAIDLYFDFEYDVNTGFMVNFTAYMNMKLVMSADNVEVPLGSLNANGTASMRMAMAMTNSFNYHLSKHSTLYQTPQQTGTSTPIGSTTPSTSTPSSSSTITFSTDFPILPVILAIGSLIVLKRKFYK